MAPTSHAASGDWDAQRTFARTSAATGTARYPIAARPWESCIAIRLAPWQGLADRRTPVRDSFRLCLAERGQARLASLRKGGRRLMPNRGDASA